MFENLLSPEVVTQIFNIGMPILLVLLGVGFIVLGAVLNYHWRSYAMNMAASGAFRLTYVIVGLALLITLGAMQALYSN